MENKCSNRREFFVKSTAAAGGLVLSFAGLNSANASEGENELLVKLDDKSPLSKVGGSQVIESPAGKIIVVRTAENSFKAYSAVCTHKGATIGYNTETKMLVCPSHNSKFDAEGKNAGGPARNPLNVYAAETSLVVKLK